ncbi:MAG: class I SAM-dependent methyltransferase [Streptosporangiaceae bacterium]
MTDTHHRHDHAAEPDWAAQAELLDLDAEVLHEYLSDVMAWIGRQAAGSPVERILDVGCGTGTGAVALARFFGQAEVTALDKSGELLARCAAKARDIGVAERVRTIEADLDQAWPELAAVNLAWASNSLHHLADPGRGLAELRAIIAAGGLLAVAELDSFPRFLPDDIGFGRPGLEARCHAALAETAAHEVPHLGDDWGARLRAAGFAVQAERTFTINLEPPLPPSAGRLATASLRRLRSGVDDRLDADDLAALDALLDDAGPRSLLRRHDLTVSAVRSAWIARPVS